MFPGFPVEVTAVADPRDIKRSSAGVATNLRVPHPSRILRRVGSKNLLVEVYTR